MTLPAMARGESRIWAAARIPARDWTAARRGAKIGRMGGDEPLVIVRRTRDEEVAESWCMSERQMFSRSWI
jgi:hypothetical protein